MSTAGAGGPGPVLVVGGTGAVGRVVVERLLAADADADVRVLSRGRRRADGAVTPVVGDLRTGEGLDAAVRGVATVVACAHPLDRLVEAAVRSGSPHVVSVSIVGVDRIPLGYYRRKLADERLLEASGLNWTVLRTTQFHDLVALAMGALTAPPAVVVPAGWRIQPVDTTDVGARLATLARGAPAGRVPDLGGPQVWGFDAQARRRLEHRGRRRPVVALPVPGAASRAMRAGHNLAPGGADGVVTVDEYLARGTTVSPYADALRAALPRRRR